jgi:hypothetical protein
LPGGTPIFAASQHQFMKHPGWSYEMVNSFKLPDFDRVILAARDLSSRA